MIKLQGTGNHVNFENLNKNKGNSNPEFSTFVESKDPFWQPAAYRGTLSHQKIDLVFPWFSLFSCI